MPKHKDEKAPEPPEPCKVRSKSRPHPVGGQARDSDRLGRPEDGFLRELRPMGVSFLQVILDKIRDAEAGIPARASTG